MKRFPQDMCEATGRCNPEWPKYQLMELCRNTVSDTYSCDLIEVTLLEFERITIVLSDIVKLTTRQMILTDNDQVKGKACHNKMTDRMNVSTANFFNTYRFSGRHENS